MPTDLDLCVSIAREAATLVRQHAGTALRLTKNANEEAVTAVDRASQRLIVSRLRALHPTDGIVGEESDDGLGITCQTPNPLGRVWVIDPIDGTNNFVAGFGAFAICIGLLEAGKPTVGVVYDVTRDCAYAGVVGQGAWMITGDVRTPMHARSEPMGPSALIMMTSNLLDPAGELPRWAVRWLTIKPWKARMIGSAALEAVQVAAGTALGAVTVNGKLWDVVAAAAVVYAAGGTLTSLDGSPLFPFDLRGYAGAKTPFLAAGPAAHEELLTEIRDFASPVRAG